MMRFYFFSVAVLMCFCTHAEDGNRLWLRYDRISNANVLHQYMQQQWNNVQNFIDEERFQQVKMLLSIQEKDAMWWKDACLLYFQTFSKMPIPSTTEKPKQSLEYYQSLKHPFAPGIGGNN